RATGRISIVGTTFHAPATHSSRITWERPTAPNQQLSKKSQRRGASSARGTERARDGICCAITILQVLTKA
ncbi:MAG: hypothetical protein WAT39_20570, partial [Planctomycetota bacterium]